MHYALNCSTIPGAINRMVKRMYKTLYNRIIYGVDGWLNGAGYRRCQRPQINIMLTSFACVIHRYTWRTAIRKGGGVGSANSPCLAYEFFLPIFRTQDVAYT